MPAAASNRSGATSQDVRRPRANPWRVDGEHLDLEPMVRDAVVLALPLSPTCTDDCSGLCVDCGERLDDLPADHSHDVVDPRWAGLAGKFTPPPGAPGGTNPKEN